MPTRNDRLRGRAVTFAVTLLLLGAAPLQAQTCAAPTHVTAQYSSGNTCTNQITLDVMAHNTVEAYGYSDVWSFETASTVDRYITVVPDSNVDAVLMACREPCGSGAATCVALSDSGGNGAVETVHLPNALGRYYLIVTALGACGGYKINGWPLD